MLPPGHLAGGFLAGKLASIWIPALNQPNYLTLSALFGFLPDLDVFVAFFKTKKWTMDDRVDHRKFPTHAPLLYLVIFLIWFWLYPASQLIAITFILGTESHLLLDTFAIEGIMWLWPFSQKKINVSIDKKISVKATNFFEYWLDFTREYLKQFSSKLEIILTVLVLAILILNLKF